MEISGRLVILSKISGCHTVCHQTAVFGRLDFPEAEFDQRLLVHQTECYRLLKPVLPKLGTRLLHQQTDFRHRLEIFLAKYIQCRLLV